MAAFRSLSTGSKIVAATVIGGAGFATAKYIMYPLHLDTWNNYMRPVKANKTQIKISEDSFQKLQETESNSLLKKHLTPEVFEKLKGRRTKVGGILYHVIKSGVENPDASVGVYAPDQESYTTFCELFDPIIQDYHQVSSTQKQPPVDFGQDKLEDFKPLDPNGKYILSTRIRCGRTLQGYPMNTLMLDDDYLMMESKIASCFKRIEDEELKGVYYPLVGMPKETQTQLVKDHFLFKDNDKHLQSANAFHFWPRGRGIFHNDSKTFLVWVGEEDHLRLISMEKGGDVGQVLDRLNRGVAALESDMTFSRDPRLGWLTSCPSNLGSTIRASVHIRLPKLSSRSDFKKVCEDLNLQVRGLHGEHSKSEGGVLDISNKRRLGVSEYEAVKEMYDGVKQLLEMETGKKSQ